MRKNGTSRRGIAAVEFAIMLPILALMLFLLVEGARAMHAYSSLVEASREGARLAVMEGGTADIQALVRSVTNDLEEDYLTTSVTAGETTITVEVAYDYQPFSDDAIDMFTGGQSLQLVAQTTMPLP